MKTYAKNSFFNFLKYFKIDILDITLSALFLAIWIIGSLFIKIQLFATQISLDYLWIMLIGLIFGPIKGVGLSIIGDTLITIFKGNLGFWIWEYAIIAPMIVIVTWMIKYLLINHREKTSFKILIINSIYILLGFVFLFLNIIEINLNFIFLSLAFFIIASISMFFLSLFKIKFNNQYYENFLVIFTICSIIIILFIWGWGPYAFIKFLMLQQNNPSFKEYLPKYFLFLFPRVIKSFLYFFLYSFLLFNIFNTFNFIIHSKFQKWN